MDAAKLFEIGRQSRRDFIKGLSVLGATTLVESTDSRAQTPSVQPRRIDVHQHFMSPNFHATMNRRNAITPIANSLDRFKDNTANTFLQEMDKAGIGTAMVSQYVGNTGFWFGDVDEVRRLARDLNEWATAKLVGEHKTRFGLFAALPLPDVEGSLREIEYAFGTLKVDGVSMITSYDNKWLGDESLVPVFDELNRHNAIVYTHPRQPDCCKSPLPGVGPQTLEFPTDTTRTIISLIRSNTATRCPNIKFIFSHAGGTLVSIAERLLGNQVTPEALAKPPEKDSRMYHVRRFYYDTAGSANPIQIQSLKLLVPATQIVFGSDYPFGDLRESVQGVQTSGLSAEELRGVYRDNAFKMLPGYAQTRLGS